MAQLPPDSHWATAPQLFGDAAEAGAARTPREAAAAPPSTTAPRRRACAGMRADEIVRLGDSRSAACEVSCRVRSDRCPGRAHTASPRGVRPERPDTEMGPPPPSWLCRRYGGRRTGFGGSAPAPGPGWGVPGQGNGQVTAVHLVPQGQPG